jgi:glucuronate isomerase
LYAEICRIPVIDVHSHVNRDHVAARYLSDLLFYHMLQYPLRTAGLSQEKLWPAGKKPWPITTTPEDFAAVWPAVESTGFGWMLKTILGELYEFAEPITVASVGRLQEAFAAKIAAKDWHRQILAKGNIVRIMSSNTYVTPLPEGEKDDIIRFTIENSPPLSGIREGFPWKERLENIAKRSNAQVTSAQTLRDYVKKYYSEWDFTGKDALVMWVSSQADYSPVTDAVVDAAFAAIAAGETLTRIQTHALESCLIRAILDVAREKTRIFQLVYGTQYVSGWHTNPVGRSEAQFASSIAYLLAEYPTIHFNILNGYEVDEQVLCSLCQGYANVSLGGFWWQNFYPSIMQQGWHRRLDMVPWTALCGFFSDGYCIDWTFGRLRLTQRVLANTLAEKIRAGFYTAEQALRVAREILFETPKRLFLPNEKIEL